MKKGVAIRKPGRRPGSRKKQTPAERRAAQRAARKRHEARKRLAGECLQSGCHDPSEGKTYCPRHASARYRGLKKGRRQDGRKDK